METIKTIDELFRWRLGVKECKELRVDPIDGLSVEKKNKEATNKLEWREGTDVLYSFLLTYKLGLEIINEKRVAEIKKEMIREKGINRLNTNSPVFLYRCSKDQAFLELNKSEEYREFVGLYFSLGNVIPIWPGGNEARGKKGIYDIPEVFFQTYRYWTEALITKYPNSCMDNILNDSFLVCRKREEGGTHIKGYKAAFSSLQELRKLMKDNNQAYFDYLKHRNDVIKARTDRMNDALLEFRKEQKWDEEE